MLPLNANAELYECIQELMAKARDEGTKLYWAVPVIGAMLAGTFTALSYFQVSDLTLISAMIVVATLSLACLLITGLCMLRVMIVALAAIVDRFEEWGLVKRPSLSEL